MCMLINNNYYYLFLSGFWGVLCVGIFSRHCLIRELYEKLCFCIFSELPSYVSSYIRMQVTQ